MSCYENSPVDGKDNGEDGHWTTCNYCGETWLYEHEDLNGNGLCDWCAHNICSHPSTTTITQSATCTSEGSIKEVCNICEDTISTEILSTNNNHTNTWGASEGSGLGGCYACGTTWCLIEGTLITMSDYTQKPIEEVKSGDLILSYDPNTKKQIPGIVVDCYETGSDHKFDVYAFSDGNTLTVFEKHGIYNAKKGYPVGIQNIDRADRFLNINNETIQWTQTSFVKYHGYKKRRFSLLTTSNLYYANNILIGNSGYVKLEYFDNRKLTDTLPQEILTVWEADAQQYDDYTNFKNNPDFNQEAKELLNQKARANSIITNNKKRLDRTDYKV